MPESLNLVRSIYEAWEQGDFGPVAWADPDIEFACVGGPESKRGSKLATRSLSSRMQRSGILPPMPESSRPPTGGVDAAVLRSGDSP
jgi:hypothetical protein